MMLSWQFADGRRCTDAGASAIAVTDNSAMPSFARCADGMAPDAVSFVVSRSGSLTVAALSPQQSLVYPKPPTDLYEGSLSLDSATTTETVTLYATAAR
jgi:hypothetical protein